MNGRRSRGAVVVLAAMLLAVAACRAGDPQERVFRRSGFFMGTLMEVTVVARDEEEAAGHLEAAFGEMDRLERLLGVHGQGGELEEINASGFPGGFVASPEVFGLLGRARRIGLETRGALDLSVGPLMRLWSFEAGGRVPAAAELAAALGKVGWDKVELDPASSRVRFAREGMLLDPGAVGQGYAADQAWRVLKDRGVEAGIVNAGGELRIWGAKPGGAGGWMTGIQHPRRAGELLGTLALTDRAVVTSGDYEKNFTSGGVLYHHLLDPATGYPSRGARSVTVVADSAEEGDAYATAFMVMGARKATEFLEGHRGLEAVIVDAEGAVHVTGGLRDVYRPAR